MDTAIQPWMLYDPHGREDRDNATAQSREEEPARERRLVCRACGYAVAREADRITIDGSHTHTCTNPHGMTFDIGCFRDARGCKAVGPSTDDFTWFAGYAWTVAVCRNCDAHLGWLFRSVADRFYGLILDRLGARDS